jgi:CheY-like chemotaxis protein
MQSAKILIVEDKELNMELATDILELAGYTVLQSTTAEQGIDVARQQKPDLIVMDVGLPGMDGLTATQVLKQDPSTRDIPVLILTAHAMKGDEEKCRQAGCDGFMAKPINTQKLPEMVASLVKSRNAGRK